VTTTITVAAGSRVWNGAANLPACVLGLVDERNWVLLAWVTLARFGRRRTPATTPTTQAATMNHRK
jgi:hypothetical protein